MPEIIWKPIGANYWSGRAGQKPFAITDHIMQGSMESSYGWFKNKGSEASAHFGIARDGRIWQFVDLNDTAWANGVVNAGPNTPDWIRVASNRGINVNRLTISIEHEGNTGEPFPEAQYQASLWLHRLLIKNYGIAIDRDHIIGHYQIDAINRPYCPGVTYPFARLMKDLTGAGAAPEVKPAAMLFPETGKEVNDEFYFLSYWKKNGDITTLGYPLTGAYFDPGYENKGRVIQVFEKAVLESHPENNPPYNVLQRHVGRDYLRSVSM